jgi:hypothetical protein
MFVHILPALIFRQPPGSTPRFFISQVVPLPGHGMPSAHTHPAPERPALSRESPAGKRIPVVAAVESPLYLRANIEGKQTVPTSGEPDSRNPTSHALIEQTQLGHFIYGGFSAESRSAVAARTSP